ncbi:MAG TPA: DUF6677 family protein [Pyrinomonadaceae bacterium]|jgi:hypothetical protein
MEERKLAETASEKGRVKAGAWLCGLLAWAVPGAGHLWAGRILSGLLLGGAVWTMYALGLLLGGHLFSLFNSTTGLLSYVFGLFNLGAGLLYVASRALEIGAIDQAERATAEYGNVFLMVAGLLNYLLALDAFDIRAGRKS